MLPLIFLIAFPFLFWSALKNIRMARESARWPTVPGTVTASERARVAWRAVPRVTYTYQVDAKDYSGRNIFIGGSPSGKETDPILSRYPPGSAVTVHYLPGKPAMAALEAGPNRYAPAVMRTYIIIFVLIVGGNLLTYKLKSFDTANNDAEPTAPTYDDKAAADPGLGDRMIRDAADKGDAKDEGYVGTWYLGGLEGYPKDPVEAAKWFRKSAGQGDAGSQSLLAELYVKGEGVPKDFGQAVEWFQKSADQGDPHGCVGIGMAYEKGVAGIPQDRQKAIEWYKKAGDDPMAKKCLERLGAD